MDRFYTEQLYYTPAVALERLVSRKNQKRLANTTLGLSLLAAGVHTAGSYDLTASFDHAALSYALPTACLLGSAAVSLHLLRLFHNSFYFRGFAIESQNKSGLTYEVARMAINHPKDIAVGLFMSPQGFALTKRLGLSSDAIHTYIGSDTRKRFTLDALDLTEGNYINMSTLATALFAADNELLTVAGAAGADRETIAASIAWVSKNYYAYKQAKRWWSKEELRKQDTLGTGLSYGYTYLLQKFAKPMRQNSVFSNLVDGSDFASEKIAELETILMRTREANAILVGEAGVGKLDLILQLAERVRRNLAPAELNGYTFIQLDTERLLATFDTKQELERTLITMLTQAANAGNIVLVINNLAALVRAGESLAVDVPTILESYLGSSELKIIATADPTSFHHELERLAIMQQMEVSYLEPATLEGTEQLLQSIARTHEVRHNLWLSHRALRAIVDSADRYIVTGVMPDKAIDLLSEVLGAASKDTDVITDAFVYEIVNKKTGIPVGPIQEEEKEVLLDLESRLHQRVIGQDAAVRAISGAMRRARAGVGSSERPLGSFLFLGPTGVGKTETAKTLAHIFFNSKEAITRLDMSEFSGPEGYIKLLGQSGTPGLLASAMQEHPYSVVLLDEFEKASQEVHDLFLQILDEGRYTDATGSIINMRNTIIIATSNAGSALISQHMAAGDDLAAHQDEIVRTIISDKVYRPELINRFDGTVLFQPLTQEEQGSVAKLLVAELQKRIEKKGYALSVTDDALAHIVSTGYHPEFGARAIRRLLQDTVEEAVAKKIIAGSAKHGDEIIITKADLAS